MNQTEFNRLVNENVELLRTWMCENLLASGEARKVTEQSNNGFNQAVGAKRIVPFFKAGGTSLYLRSELIEYRDNKRVIVRKNK